MVDGLTAEAANTFAVARTDDGRIQCGTLSRAPSGDLELTFGNDGTKAFSLSGGIADISIVDDCPLEL